MKSKTIVAGGILRNRSGWCALLGLAMAACNGSSGGSRSEDGVRQEATGDATPMVVLETNRGRIVMELDRQRAPESVANFLLHVKSGFYNDIQFHRVMPGFMIQAGVLTSDMQRRISPVFPVANEAQNGLKNLRGTVAMARTSDPHSATSEFFINLVDNAVLDFSSATPRGWGYAVFGRITEGMDVVDAVAAILTTGSGRYQNLPLEPTVIDTAYVVPSGAAAAVAE